MLVKLVIVTATLLRILLLMLMMVMVMGMTVTTLAYSPINSDCHHKGRSALIVRPILQEG